jgi:hypothetical protein
MINRNEIEIAAAQKCGISPEMSSIFFEVFINRVSNRLKPGETLPFDNHGYFQKRNCRFKVEKSPEHPEGKSYLFNLVLFSENQIIKDNFNSVIYLRIPDLKTLWKDDREFHNSLRAGDFYPFTDRNQLIKSFATKAEVIISGMMKTYDSDLEEELIIPYSNDLNFELEVREKPDLTGTQKDESGNTLPWGFGSKFMEGKEQGSKTEGVEKPKQTENKELIQKNEEQVPKKEDEKDPAKQNLEIDEALKSAFEESKIKSEHIFKPDFEPVKSRISTQPRNRAEREDQSMLRQSRGDSSTLKSSNKSENKFTEVKSKTEVYHLQENDKKSQKKNKLFEKEYKPTPPPFSPPKRYYGNRNLVAIIVILSVIIILGAVIYIYLIKDDSVKFDTEKILLSVNTPPDVNIIDREYDYAVSYPYPKLEQNIPIEGINPKVFTEQEEPTEKVTKPLVEKPIVEKEPEVKNVVQPEIKTVEKPVVTPEKTEKKVNRIFLLNNYFVVQVGTYSTYAAADKDAEKYFNEGYNAMVEVVEVPGKPTRYVLNVGDFTSEEFARDFETKYLK